MTLHLTIDDRLVTSEPDVDEEMEELRRLSGQGDSQGWKFNRAEIYERPQRFGGLEVVNPFV